MGVRLNIFTGTLQFTDSLAQLETILGGLFLKLDQTIPQTVVNGAPDFGGGIVIRAGEKIIMDGD